MDTAPAPVLRAFGGIGAHGPTGPVDLGGPKQQAVLALLLLDPGTVVSLDRIVDRIWGDAPPARADVSVRGYVSNLRRALAALGFEPRSVIEHRDSGYVLQVPAHAVDLHWFDARVDEGRQLERLGELAPARAVLIDALAHHGGPALGPAAESLGLGDVALRYEERRSEAIETLFGIRLALGEHREIVDALRTEIERQPYREHLRAMLALALYRAGRTVEALRALDDARRCLRDDIGIEPGPELQSLEAAILAHDEAALAWAPPTAPSPPGPHRPRPSDAGADADRSADIIERAPHFGRAFEEQRAIELLDRLAGRGGVLVVTGEAGIGKSTLLRTLRAAALERTLSVAWDRCPESASAAPYRSWRALARTLIPGGDLHTDAAGPDDEAAGAVLTTHLHELDRLRKRTEPAVVVVDDLQWADDASLSLLTFLAPELESLRILLAVGVRRSGRAELAPAVRDCLAELARTSDPIHLTLSGLSADHVAAWVSAITARPASSSMVEHLLETTDGNPFYLRELLTLLESEGGLEATDSRWVPPVIPHAVQDVVRRRTSRLPPDTQALLAVASVIGRRFDLDVLAGVLDLDARDVLTRLEPALDDGLVEVDDALAGRFAFSHTLVSSTLEAELSPLRLARHHAQIAAVLEQLRTDDLDPWVEELARHAGQGILAGSAPMALDYALRAADAAATAQSPSGVAHQMGRAVKAARHIPGFPTDRRRELLVRLGVAQRDSGDPAGRATLVEAARLAEAQRDTHALAEILGGLDTESLWASYDWNRFDQRVVAHVERALEQTGLSTIDRARLTMALAGELVYLDGRRSASLFAEARALTAAVGDPVLTARCLIRWYWSVSGPAGQPIRAAIGDQLIALAESGGLPPRLEPLAYLARVSAALDVGDAETLRHSLEQARALAHPVRTPTGWAHLQYTEAGLALLEGDLDGARSHAAALRPALHLVRRYTAETSPASILAVVETEAGRHDEALAWLRVLQTSPYEGPIRWLEAWILSSAGRDDEARSALAAFDGPLPDDWLRIPLTTAAVHAAARVGDDRFLRRHLPLLEPWSDRLSCAGEGGLTFGPVGLTVGAAHLRLGDPAAARRHGERALRVSGAIGSPLWTERARAWLDGLTTA